MTRTTTWLSTFSCAVLLAAIGGCGSSSPANSGKGGSGGSHDGAAGSGGNAGSTSDASGQAGSTDDAAAGSGGATADGGTAGSGGAKADGGTAGSGGAGGVKADGGTAGSGGAKADAGTDTGTDATPTPCVLGGTCAQDFTCTMTRSCRRNEEQFCFCDPNNKIACEACDTIDAGTDGGGADAGVDSGTDAGAGIPMCPANVMNRNTTCTTFNERCAVNACANRRQEQCLCVMFGQTGRWFCNQAVCQ